MNLYAQLRLIPFLRVMNGRGVDPKDIHDLQIRRGIFLTENAQPPNGYPADCGIEVIRVSGDYKCDVCGHTYRDHPYDLVEIGYDGFPFLREGCDGKRLKL